MSEETLSIQSDQATRRSRPVKTTKQLGRPDRIICRLNSLAEQWAKHELEVIERLKTEMSGERRRWIQEDRNYWKACKDEMILAVEIVMEEMERRT